MRRPEYKSASLLAPHGEAALYPVVHADGKDIIEGNTVVDGGRGFSFQEGYPIRQFVLYLQPRQGQRLAIGYLYLKDDLFSEENLAMTQAAFIFDAVQAILVPQS